MSLLLDKTLAMLADQPAHKIAVLAREKRLANFLTKAYLPRDWELGENPLAVQPDSQESLDHSMNEEALRQKAEATWNKLTKPQQDQVMEQLIALDPNRLEMEDFRALDYVEDEGLATLHL